ncbi:MAG: hypothetical protein GY884_32275 [Proteobacteria bacterium]|nr:hypothetical protein [Pseudomonadota bacterium]
MIWSTAALAATISLGPDEKLQDAVDGASDGDTIEVALSYVPFEPFVDWSGKDLTIQGAGGLADIPPLAVDDASLVLREIRIQGSGTSAYPVSMTLASDKGPEELVIKECVFEGNALPVVVYAFSPAELTVEVVDSTFSENTTTQDGAAIRGTTLRSAKVTWSTFDRNAAEGDGGALAFTAGNGGAVRLESVDFSGNEGGSQGGDMTVEGYDLAAQYVMALDGQANAGGFLYVKESSAVSLDDVIVHRPKATTSGGAIYTWDVPSVRISRSLFCGASNESTDYHGAFMHLDGPDETELSMSNTVVHGTTGGDNSPAIRANEANLEFIHTTRADNRTAYGVILGQTLSGLNLENTIVTGATSFVNYGEFVGTAMGTHNLWDEITSVEFEPRDDFTDLTDDPYSLFETDPNFEDFTGGDCTTEPTLAEGSLAIDAGKGDDADGSPADIGAYGGENSADLFVFPEPDGGEDTGPIDSPPDSPVDSPRDSDSTPIV